MQMPHDIGRPGIGSEQVVSIVADSRNHSRDPEEPVCILNVVK